MDHQAFDSEPDDDHLTPDDPDAAIEIYAEAAALDELAIYLGDHLPQMSVEQRRAELSGKHCKYWTRVARQNLLLHEVRVNKIGTYAALTRCGITHSTLKRWIKLYPKFASIYDIACQERDGVMPGPDDPGFAAFRWRYFGMRTFVHQQQTVDAIENSVYKSVTLVLTFPESGKTTLLEDYVCYRLAVRPNDRIKIISQSRDHALNMMNRIKGRLTDHDISVGPDGEPSGFIDQWGPFYEKGQEATKPWRAGQITVCRRTRDERDPSLEAIGVAGRIQGRRADLILIDDPQDIDAVMAGKTTRLLQKIRQEVLSRLSDTGIAVWCATRVADGDIYDQIFKIPDAEQFVDRTIIIPALDADGASTCPDMWPVEKLEHTRKKVGESAWWRCYMMSPKAAGSKTFNEGLMKRAQRPTLTYGQIEPGTPVYLSVDPALGGACTTTVWNATPDALTLVDALQGFGYDSLADIFADIDSMCVWYPVNVVIIEDNVSQKAILNDAELATLAAKHGFLIEAHTTGSNKLDRDFGVSAMVRSFLKAEIHIPWADDACIERFGPMVNQFIDWRPGVPDRILKQDWVMSTWFAWRYWMTHRKTIPTEGAPTQNWNRSREPVPAWQRGRVRSH